MQTRKFQLATTWILTLVLHAQWGVGAVLGDDGVRWFVEEATPPVFSGYESAVENEHTLNETLVSDPQHDHSHQAGHDYLLPCFREHAKFHLTEFTIYPTFSYLGDQSATYTEFEIASHTDFGWLEMENRTVLNVADLPSTIKLGPTNPGVEPPAPGPRGNGFGDILSGFFFSPAGAHEQSTHLGVGPVLTFPTASNSLLGSDQFTAGPGLHFSTEFDRLTAGFFLWQSWGFGEGTGDKKVNQLFGKPFIIYELTETWHFVYIPLGMSHSWDAPSGDNWTVPIGGGLRKLFTCRGHDMGFQFQAFDYVARKSKDPEWELRATIEFFLD